MQGFGLHRLRMLSGCLTLVLFTAMSAYAYAGGGIVPSTCSCAGSVHTCGTAPSCRNGSCDCCRMGTGAWICKCCTTTFDCVNPPSGWNCG